MGARERWPAPSRAHAAADGELDDRRAILAAKVRPPPPRDGLISRTALVDRMLAQRSEPVVAVVAPPGYGKTTLLAEWSSRQQRETAWISIDEVDNDPAALLLATAVAFSQLRRIDPQIIEALTSPRNAISAALDALMAALEPPASVTIILDNVESIRNAESLDLIAELAWRLPPGSQLAYGSRSPLPLPMPRLRASGSVVDIGSDDLAMDRTEAHALLQATGADLTSDEMDRLWEKTEGWPAGLYLAGLASQSRQTAAAAFAFHGDDRLMADYLRTEILGQLPAATVSFLTRTSVLEQLSGPLCDAVLGGDGSQEMLESLESSNLLVVPLDRRRAWYRYHHLFRDLLQTELVRREPELVPCLHGLAARWLQQRGMPEMAIRHAQRADDPDLVMELVTAATQPAYAAGRIVEARGWLEWFRAEGLIDRFPRVAVLGALVEALSGRPAGAQRWTAAAEQANGLSDHDDTFEGLLAYLRSVLCRRGVAQMRIDAQLARAKLGPTSNLRAGASLFEGLANLLGGDLEVADALFARTYDEALYMEALPAAAAALAFRGTVALRRQEWDEAAELAERALSIVERGQLQGYIESSAVHALAARTAARAGDVRAATEYLVRATHIRPLLTYAVPSLALIQLELARAYLQVADPVGARTVLRELRDILTQRPDLGVIAEEAQELQVALDAIRHGRVGMSSLTAAELRLLPFLATHLTFPEIGDRLNVSRHTIKTQAISVYRKLGVSSRSEAIQCAYELGLLGR